MKLGKSMNYVTKKSSLFAKMNGLIALLFIPILALYTYSNQVATDVVDKELKASNIRQLSFLSGQIDSRINQTMDFVVTFSRDPNVRKFNGLNIWDDRYDKMQTRYVIQEKMALQSGIMNIWPVRFTVYSQLNQEAISNASEDGAAYDEDYLKRNVTGKWSYGDGTEPAPGQQPAFHWFYTDSFGQQNVLMGSNLVVEARFKHDNIQNMLDSYKAGGRGDPIFYHRGDKPIANRSASAQLTDELVRYLDGTELKETMQQVVKLQGKSYLISAVLSPQLGWHLVDAVPVDQILGPISYSRNMFYLTMVLLSVVGISASVLIYRNVQRPIRKLIRGLQSVQRGDFSVRIDANANNEFAFLFYRFNDMSRQIQSLIENVLNEKLRAREATLKQLQAQINPHFLYNCIGYMINMAQMKDEEAVVSMGHNLSAYYRYITRMERPTASLGDEIRLIVNYLDIQKLRNGRIHYSIDIPDEMQRQQVPRLLLQPIVENAVIHGVGKSYSSGEIRIVGETKDGLCRICVDDDGPGLNEEQLEALNRKMKEPLQDDMGYGFWNTSQRLVTQFGEKSGLRFSGSELGGLRTEIVWEIPESVQTAERSPKDHKEGDRTDANDHR
ncbi:two-component sensor histidine kinase [Cohnella sp. CIP 111063]|jgi:two-component system sensor histidine kinase YesM|uniref:sensor histidine kinase n=1 Tax=unclassified Cohnella TaxID=2636738 RepID=UPI000B9D11A8|nr:MULTISPECIES: histidine kinase [unclassified Cohnella]OXS62692.1 two-component sensor histidine kinase [Cohnella sp. CIP 111063]PRX74959.1 two-component system sensor histidine kinase YesM [Cohnella sp. SGD-V74]